MFLKQHYSTKVTIGVSVLAVAAVLYFVFTYPGEISGSISQRDDHRVKMMSAAVLLVTAFALFDRG